MQRSIHGVIGKWWGTNPETKKTEKIDIVLTKKVNGKKIGYFAECKYRNETVGNDVLDTLIRRSALVKGYDERRFVIFSKSGFAESLKDRDVILISWSDMVSTD